MNQNYNPTNNTLSADIMLNSSGTYPANSKTEIPALMVITFKVCWLENCNWTLLCMIQNTQRDSKSPKNSGFTNLRITRPGYDHWTTQIFTDDAAIAVQPFDHLRFMGCVFRLR